MNETKGTGIMTTAFHKYDTYKGKLKKNSKGALISSAAGVATAYGINRLEKFGVFFVKPGDQVRYY
jgi:GTP-binding protein